MLLHLLCVAPELCLPSDDPYSSPGLVAQNQPCSAGWPHWTACPLEVENVRLDYLGAARMK